VSALLAHVEGPPAQAGIVGDEHVGVLASESGYPAHQPPHRLAEEEIRGGIGREDPHAQSRDIDALGDHAHGDDPGIRRSRVLGDPPRGRRVIGGDHAGANAEALAQGPTDGAGVILIHRDGEGAGTRIVLAEPPQLLVGALEDRRQPLALDGERGAQALTAAHRVQQIVEGVGVELAIPRAPLHLASDAREVDRSYHPPIPQRLAVAVLEVGLRLVARVLHEGDGAVIGAEGRARE
jgi:hypothetical protein